MKRRLVAKHGVNDLGYTVTKVTDKISKTGKSYRANAVICPFYETWRGMLFRVYSEKKPKYYEGVTVDPSWHSANTFKIWMESQNWEGLCLDKDLLFPGNKLYSDKTCCFIPELVNTFLCLTDKTRGTLPLGVSVSWKNESGLLSYKSQCNIDQVQVYLGSYTDPTLAHRAWQNSKLQEFKKIIEYAKSFSSLDSRVVPALEKLKAGLENDIISGLETFSYHW